MCPTCESRFCPAPTPSTWMSHFCGTIKTSPDVEELHNEKPMRPEQVEEACWDLDFGTLGDASDNDGREKRDAVKWIPVVSLLAKLED